MPKRVKKLQQKTTVLPELSRLELEIMGIVWDLGKCTPRQVISEFRSIGSLADNTVRTVLTNIRKKGYIEIVPSVGRSMILRPCVTRKSVARKSLKSLLSNLFGDSPREIVAYLVKDENIDADELAEIRKLLDEGESKAKKKQT